MRGKGAQGAAGRRERPLAGFEQGPPTLLLLPKQLFHKTAATFLPIKKFGAGDALLPEKTYFPRPGAKAVKGIGGGLFAPTGVGQAQHAAQGIGQQRVRGGRARQLVVRGVHNEHTVKVQQAGFQHAQDLQARERFSLKGHALLLQHATQYRVQHCRLQGGLRQAIVAQPRGHMTAQAVEGFGVQRKAPPDVPAVQQQKVTDPQQTAGGVFQSGSRAEACGAQGQGFVQQSRLICGDLGGAGRDYGRQVHKARARADVVLQTAQGLAQGRPRDRHRSAIAPDSGVRASLRRAGGGAQQIKVGVAQTPQQGSPVVAAIRIAGFLQAQQGIQQAVEGGALQRIAHGDVHILVRQVVQHRHKQGAVRQYHGRGGVCGNSLLRTGGRVRRVC